MDDQFIQREEEEQGKEFEEEAEEDYDYLDYAYDNSEKIEHLIDDPMVTSWCHSDGKTWEEVVISNWPILDRSKNISMFRDVCTICFKALAGSGIHQICCLPCGHIYGRSCIDHWLQQSQNNSKCPQCKSLCTLKDVILLQPTRPCDAVGALPKESGKWFPFTKQGFKTFKRYAVRQVDDASRMRVDVQRRIYDKRLHDAIYRRWNHWNGAVKLPKIYYQLASKYSSQNDKLDNRKMLLLTRVKKYHAGLDFVEYLYEKHMKRNKKARKPLRQVELMLL